MLQTPMEVLQQFPVRKSGKQKSAFRDAVCSYASSLGYSVLVEKGAFGVHNIVIGDPGTAKHLLTAHYDTPAALPFPNLITPCNFWAFLGYQLVITIAILIPSWLISGLVHFFTNNGDLTFFVWYFSFFASFLLMLAGPANKNNFNDNTSGVITVLEAARALSGSSRQDIAFVLFDLEEVGLVGSSAYQRAHKKETGTQIIWNMDCVGNGDEILLFPTGKLKKDTEKMQLLRRVCTSQGSKSISVRPKGFAIYPSDQTNFPFGVGIAAFQRSKGFGLYCGRLHTKRDTILQAENISLLCRALRCLGGEEALEVNHETV